MKGNLGSWNNRQKLKTKNEQTNKIKTIVLPALQPLLRPLGRSQQLPVGTDGLSGLHGQVFIGQYFAAYTASKLEHIVLRGESQD